MGKTDNYVYPSDRPHEWEAAVEPFDDGDTFGYLFHVDGVMLSYMVIGDHTFYTSEKRDMMRNYASLASIMAAAPDLLAALEEATDMIEHVIADGYHYGGSHEIISEAKEAIAKAKLKTKETT